MREEGEGEEGEGEGVTCTGSSASCLPSFESPRPAQQGELVTVHVVQLAGQLCLFSVTSTCGPAL